MGAVRTGAYHLTGGSYVTNVASEGNVWNLKAKEITTYAHINFQFPILEISRTVRSIKQI